MAGCHCDLRTSDGDAILHQHLSVVLIRLLVCLQQSTPNNDSSNSTTVFIFVDLVLQYVGYPRWGFMSEKRRHQKAGLLSPTFSRAHYLFVKKTPGLPVSSQIILLLKLGPPMQVFVIWGWFSNTYVLIIIANQKQISLSRRILTFSALYGIVSLKYHP
jgi:hypothetical protein